VSDTENRDPFPCPKCETVNAWNATTCRSCKEAISKPSVVPAQPLQTEEIDDTTADNSQAPPVSPSQMPAALAKRQWNIFWIVLGIAVHVAGVHIGVFSILKFLVEPDAEVKATIEKTLLAAKENALEDTAILENAPEPLRSKLQTIRGILLFILAVVPVLIGLSAGFFSRTVLDGAASMGLSAVLIPLLSGAPEYAIIWGPINAALGALGAVMGVGLARRFRPTGASNDLAT
jgi:hypothetical protein